MTVFEPDTASWRSANGLLVAADVGTGSIVVRWSLGSRPAHLVNDITVDVDQADELESMLMNARLWLRKSAAQHAEVAAADQLNDDLPVLCLCTHPADEHCEYFDGNDTQVCNRGKGWGCHSGDCRCGRTHQQVLDDGPLPKALRYYPIPTETTTGRNPR